MLLLSMLGSTESGKKLVMEEKAGLITLVSAFPIRVFLRTILCTNDFPLLRSPFSLFKTEPSLKPNSFLFWGSGSSIPVAALPKLLPCFLPPPLLDLPLSVKPRPPFPPLPPFLAYFPPR